ncbi:MAG: (2Fe-2S)-binding protein [Spirochaetes bacterium]|nr:MAG: (2Fe-2S)-binding protein [Spirochaetota bacterium]
MNTLFTVNGRKVRLSLHPGQTLLRVLRDNGYTEVKCGCEEGECGSCTVLLDGEAVPSCQILAMSVRNREITTVKGLMDMDGTSVIPEAFAETGAVQCGFCTPGMVLSSYALLKGNPAPSEEEIKLALDGNICRCTGYIKIIEAVKLAAVRMGKK